MKVLVTDGDTRPALAVTRSLSRVGHEVIVGADRLPSLASVSRHCAGRETYPSPQREPEGFVLAVAEIVRRRNIDLLLPITEMTTWLIAQARGTLPRRCALVLPSTESLRIANDKARVLALAQELGIPVPQTRIAKSAELDSDDFAGLPFPVVMKPARSRVLTPAGWISTGAIYCNNVADLARRLHSLPGAVFPVLVQERIVGAGVGVFSCYGNGSPITWFSHRRLREKPPSGGVSVLCESAPLDRIAVEQARSLLSAMNWHGVAMVEFKRDDRTGALHLMEINGRFWGSLQLAIDAGIDFPALAARIASGESVAPVDAYRVGVRSRWFLGDLDALLAVFFKPSARLNLPPGHPTRLRSLRDFLHLWRRDQRNDIFRIDDPRPGLLEGWQWLTGK